MIDLLGIGVATALISFLATGYLRKWLESRGVLDIPNARSSHVRPTPRGGGLAFMIVTTLGLALSWVHNPVWPVWALVAYIVGAWLISLVSWLDDLRTVPIRLRFTAHSLGAILAILGVGYWGSILLPVVGLVPLGWAGPIITFVWIVGLTNAYNFMDGIDGIAGGQAVVAGVGWAVLGSLRGEVLVMLLGMFLAASSLGFLGHNWPPARIFMGDVGSAFLGYTFAVLSVLASQSDARLGLAGVLLIWPFLFDAIFTFARRACNHEDVFAAHRTHLYQRMVLLGYSHLSVTLLFTALASTGVFLAVIWSQDLAFADELIVLMLTLMSLALWASIWRQERQHSAKPKAR